MQVDTAFGLETPEGTVIELAPAGIFARSLAFLVDEVLRWTIIGASLALSGMLGVFGQGLAMIVFFVCYWLYGVAFEVLNNGVTPGKKLQGLRVMHDDGTPIALPASMLRNLLLWADLLPSFYLAGLVSMLLSPRFQRLGDLAAGTLVVYDAPKRADAVSYEPGKALTTAVPLRQDEQSVLIDYLERSDSLTTERLSELAGLVREELLLSGSSAEEDLKRLALGLRGG